MPALAAAEETRLSGPAAGSLPELASFRAAFPGYEDTRELDGLRESEYWYLDAEGHIYLDYTGAGLPAQAQLSAHAAGLSWMQGVGIDVIGQRVACLTGWMLNQLTAMRHGNGQPMARIHGPADTRDRGGTVAFNLLDPRGRVVDARTVAQDASAAGISVRTGCFCNPGAAEAAFRLGPSDVARSRWLAAGSTDRYMETIGVPGGAIRASVGLASTVEDVERFLTLLETTYRDQLPHGG